MHAYTQGASGKTSYLAELATGQIVTVAHAAGRTRTSVVGRVKVLYMDCSCFNCDMSMQCNNKAIQANADDV